MRPEEKCSRELSLGWRDLSERDAICQDLQGSAGKHSRACWNFELRILCWGAVAGAGHRCLNNGILRRKGGCSDRQTDTGCHRCVLLRPPIPKFGPGGEKSPVSPSSCWSFLSWLVFFSWKDGCNWEEKEIWGLGEGESPAWSLTGRGKCRWVADVCVPVLGTGLGVLSSDTLQNEEGAVFNCQQRLHTFSLDSEVARACPPAAPGGFCLEHFAWCPYLQGERVSVWHRADCRRWLRRTHFLKGWPNAMLFPTFFSERGWDSFVCMQKCAGKRSIWIEFWLRDCDQPIHKPHRTRYLRHMLFIFSLKGRS